MAGPPLIAASLWAWQGGNPAGTSTGARPWFFRLTWQNAFDFIPSNPSTIPALKTDITYDATAIKTAALDALKQAYKAWPVTVFEGTTGGDHRAVIQTTSNQGPSCGFTDPNNSPPQLSTVVYECNMEQSQIALQVVINNAPDETVALGRQDLIQAIGRGIGATAAHEIAHQFLGLCCNMDVLTSQDPNAAATYNNGDGDGDPNPQVPNSDPAPYTGYGKDGKTPIHWEATTQQDLAKCLASGWTDYGLTNCAVKLQLSLNRRGLNLQGGVWSKAVLPQNPRDPE